MKFQQLVVNLCFAVWGLSTAADAGAVHGKNAGPVVENQILSSSAATCKFPQSLDTVTVGYPQDIVISEYNINIKFKQLPFTPIPSSNPSLSDTVDYFITKPLGIGSYGVITEAINQKTKEKVALKILFKSPECLNGVYPEFAFAPLLNKLKQHSNIASPDKIFKVGNNYGMEMKLFAGDLFSKIYDEPRPTIWPLIDLAKLSFQILTALQALHSRGIVHSDIKPENIFTSSKKDYYLGDFGLAVKLPLKDATHGGTPGYVPPESKASFNNLSFKNDIFALGMTLLEPVLYDLNEYYKYNQAIKGKNDGKTALDKFREKIKYIKPHLQYYEMAKDPLVLSQALDVMDKAYAYDIKQYRLFKNFVLGLLRPSPSSRYSSERALQHEFITKYLAKLRKSPLSKK